MGSSTRLGRFVFAFALAFACAAPTGCERRTAEIEVVDEAHVFSRAELRAIQQIADVSVRDVRAVLPDVPKGLRLVVQHGKDVIPETGENGTTLSPASVVWTVDPDRGVLGVVRNQLRPSLFHEIHHLVRANATATGKPAKKSLMDLVVTEGMATAFERDFAKVDPPWGKAPPEIMEWTREVLAQPADAAPDAWLMRHADGRRWVGMRVGTFLVDRATKASGRSSADLVAASTEEIVRVADVR